MKLERKLSDELVGRIVSATEDIASRSEDRHFVSRGKSFFNTWKGILLLKDIHRELDVVLNFEKLYSEPIIEHAYLLYKSPGGPATKVHQDRAYWKTYEDEPSMFTVWIALEDIPIQRGCLIINKDNEGPAGSFAELNSRGGFLEHCNDTYGGGGFSMIIAQELRERIEPNMVALPAQKGDIIVFDSLEPHGATENTSDATRLALKVVYGDGSRITRRCLAKCEHLSTSTPGGILKSYTWGQVANVRAMAKSRVKAILQ